MNTDGHGWKQGFRKPEKLHPSASQVYSAFLLPAPPHPCESVFIRGSISASPIKGDACRLRHSRKGAT